jgi:hypothetical protein
MKTITRIPLREIFMNNPFAVRRADPALVFMSSTASMRTVEIRRSLRQMRESRQYTFTRDFLY